MNKQKWIIIGAVLFAVVVAAVVAGIFIGRSTGSSSIQFTEPDKYSLSGKVIISPDILKEEAAFLEVTYEVDKGWLNQDVLVFKWVQLKNNSTNYLERASISLEIFDGKGKELRREQSGYIGIGPGKIGSTRFGVPFKELSATPKNFTLTLESVTWKTASIPSITPATPTTSGPKEAALKFFDLLKTGQYTEAENLLSPECIPGYLRFWSSGVGKKYASLEDAWRDNPARIPQKAEIISIYEAGKEDSELEIRLTFPGGQVEKIDIHVTKRSGSWKLILP